MKRKKQLRHYWDELGIEGDPVLNAGVLVIDTECWQRENITEQAEAHKRRHPSIGDEEALNLALDHRFSELSPKWNFFGFLLDLDLEASIEPAFYHYLSRPKPWSKRFCNDDPIHRARYVSFFDDSPWPMAAKLGDREAERARYLRQTFISHVRRLPGGVQLLSKRRRERRRWLRRVVVDLYNQAIDESRYCDHVQGFTPLSKIDPDRGRTDETSQTHRGDQQRQS